MCAISTAQLRGAEVTGGRAQVYGRKSGKARKEARAEDGGSQGAERGKGGGRLSIGKMKADQWPTQWDLGTLKDT